MNTLTLSKKIVRSGRRIRCAHDWCLKQFERNDIIWQAAKRIYCQRCAGFFAARYTDVKFIGQFDEIEKYWEDFYRNEHMPDMYPHTYSVTES